ncbi:unnamed protein product [Brachionus calyciflorus]|uniref:Uncharacterized protein n=1 Tax=Brachionus calyciflorus TaxID=104777 RepID=A0A814DJM4_9BILA|nr:unnamed protein product [Brachionus calyciflorus]
MTNNQYNYEKIKSHLITSLIGLAIEHHNAYRTSQQATTSSSPFELLYGREPRPGDLDNYNLGYEPSEFIKILMKIGLWQDLKL